MLFRSHQPHRPAPRRRPQPASVQLPSFMHRLSVLCHDHGHPLPVRMTHIADSLSDRGQAMAVYACPICNARCGWVIDFHSGKPRRLWHRHGGPQRS